MSHAAVIEQNFVLWHCSLAGCDSHFSKPPVLLPVDALKWPFSAPFVSARSTAREGGGTAKVVDRLITITYTVSSNQQFFGVAPNTQPDHSCLSSSTADETAAAHHFSQSSADDTASTISSSSSDNVVGDVDSDGGGDVIVAGANSADTDIVDASANSANSARPPARSNACQQPECRESCACIRLLDANVDSVHGGSTGGPDSTTTTDAPSDAGQCGGSSDVNHGGRLGSGASGVRPNDYVPRTGKRRSATAKRRHARPANTPHPHADKSGANTTLCNPLGHTPTPVVVAPTTAAIITTTATANNNGSSSGASKRKRRNERANALIRRFCALLMSCLKWLFSSSTTATETRPADPPMSNALLTLLIGAILLGSTVSMVGATTATDDNDSNTGGLWLLSDNAVRFSYTLCRSSSACQRAYYLSIGTPPPPPSTSSVGMIDYDWELFQHLYGIFAQQHVGMPACATLQQCFDDNNNICNQQELLQLWHELLISTPFCGTNEAFVVGVGCRCREGAQCEHNHAYGSRLASAAGESSSSVDGRFFVLRGDITSLHLLLLLAMALVAYLAYRLWSNAVQNEASQERLFALFQSTSARLDPSTASGSSMAPPGVNMGISY